MENRPSIIERAFQLAKSGQCLSVDDIRKQLAKERYEMVDAFIRGTSLLTQLRNQVNAAQTERRNAAAKADPTDLKASA